MTETSQAETPSDGIERPERKTRELPNGETVREAGDCRFVASPSRTVHGREECECDGFDYEYHPTCGQRLPDGSMWSKVDAADAEEAVLKYNLVPCTQCIENSRVLDRWRKALYSSLVMHNTDPPQKWVEYANGAGV